MYKKYNDCNQYYNERNILLGVFYNMESNNKGFQKADKNLKELATKCVKAIRYYFLDSDETIKRYFEIEVQEKLEKRNVLINYRTFMNYLKSIENQTMSIDKQMVTARILIENTFDDGNIMHMLWRACDGQTFIYDEPLDNYRAYKRELNRKKREYY